MGTVYATAQEFKDTGLPPVALQGLVDADITAALSRASGMVDSYIGQRFKLPLLAYGADVKQATIDLASWFVMARRGFQPGAADAEVVRLRYDDALRWLKDVQRGVATPQWPDSVEAGGLDPTLAEGSFASQKPGGGIALEPADDDLVVSPPSSRGW